MEAKVTPGPAVTQRLDRDKSCVCAAEPSTAAAEELTQHKNYLKVVRRQEREMKEAEKKSQKKGEDLIQKYSEAFKALKKKASLKKKE